MAKICYCGSNRDMPKTFPDTCSCYKCCANIGAPQGPIVGMTMSGGAVGVSVRQVGGINANMTIGVGRDDCNCGSACKEVGASNCYKCCANIRPSLHRMGEGDDCNCGSACKDVGASNCYKCCANIRPSSVTSGDGRRAIRNPIRRNGNYLGSNRNRRRY